MQKMIQSKVVAWLRGLVWMAMIAGCAWASAQNYLVQPASGNYHAIALGHGEGLGLGMGEGAQSSPPLPKDDLFAGTEVFAKGASDITEITMDPDSLNMVGGPDQHRARTMVLNVVRTYTYDKPGMYNMADVDAIRNKLNTGDWHCSVHVRDLKNGTGSDICNKRRSDGMKETAIIEVEPKQLTFIHTIRKENGPGSSELGFFPMLPGLHGLPLLAMTDPEALAEMPLGMGAMPWVMTPDVRVFVRGFSGDINSPEMKLKMDELNKQMEQLKLHPPIDQEQMQKLKEQMKEFDKDFYKEKDKDKTAPATPQATPAPAPPQAPQ